MTHHNVETLIVTSAINPPDNMPFLSLRDPKKRLLQTYCGLIRWIQETIIKNIVLCDNSGAKDAFGEIAYLAKQHNKSLEVLVFEGNQEQACIRGKGYGEGEIMKYVMEHSRLLHDDATFYKITGRIFVEGFNTLHHNYANKSVVFAIHLHNWRLMNVLLRFTSKDARISYCRRHIGTSYLETTFYKCTKQYYMKNLMDQFQQVDDRRGYYLEHALLSSLLERDFDVFSKHPCIVGYSGSNGQLYGSVDYSNKVKNMAELLLSSNQITNS